MTFLRNFWYIAAWSDEVSDRPFARTILGAPIVLYRKRDGDVAALEDRCAHRALPLSLGTVVGNDLQCAYHGLTFDGTGACVRVPGQAAIPPGAAVRSYPVTERWRWIWVWTGDPALADAALVPDFHWLDTPGWVVPTGMFHLEADYRRLVDNLLDFSHVQFVHRRTIGTDAITTARSQVRRDGDAVEVTRWILDSPPPPLFANAGGFNGNVDRWINCRFTPPSSVVFDIGCAEVGTGATGGDRSHGIEIRSLHGITPETETTAHYFWGYARNFRLDDEAVTELLREGARATFAEDVEILKHLQIAFDRAPSAPEIDINDDAAPLLGRRVLAELLAREALG